jgi:hypothetical protein
VDEVEIIEISTSSVNNKTLETKRKASCDSKRVAGKRRKAENRNETSHIREGQSRAAKNCGNASLVKGGSSDTNEVATIETPTSSVNSKTL